jgi:hypothetical protein
VTSTKAVANMAIISRPDPGHDPEAPEHHRHVGHRVPGGRLDQRGRGLARIIDIALEQQGVAQVAAVLSSKVARAVMSLGLTFSASTAP